MSEIALVDSSGFVKKNCTIYIFHLPDSLVILHSGTTDDSNQPVGVMR